jgi:heat shock protein HslJ
MRSALPSRFTAASAILALALALACAACGARPAELPTATDVPASTINNPQARPTREPLLEFQGTTWRLTALNGSSPIDGVVITLSLVKGTHVTGYSGCSDYWFVYDRSGDQFRFASFDSISYGCVVPGAASQEGGYFQALAAVAAYRVSPGRLEFENGSGETILAFDPWLRPTPDPALEGRLWILEQLRGQPLVEGSLISIRFGYEPRLTTTENSLTGFAGCSRYSGDFEAADQGILLVNRANVDSNKATEEECPGPKGAAEQQITYIDALRSAASYHLTDGHLEVRDLSGKTILVYVPQEDLRRKDGGLAGTAWQFVSMEGRELTSGLLMTLTFHDEQQGSGHAGCVDYSLHYSAHDGDVGSMGIAYLGFDCPLGAYLDEETAFVGSFLYAEHYRLSDGQLELITLWGETMVFKPLPAAATADLGGSTWSLQAFLEPDPYSASAEAGPVLPDVLEEISIHFETGMASGLAGCNMYSAAYRRRGTSLSLDPIAVTGMACQQQGIMEQEQRYLSVLQAVTSGQVYGDHLWLETEDGRVLAFTMTEKSAVAELRRDSVFIQYDSEEEAGPAEASVPFGRVPEFYLLADGSVFYVERGEPPQVGQPEVVSARLTAAEVQELMQQVMDRGFERLETWACPCQQFAYGTSRCIAYESGSAPLLRMRTPSGDLEQLGIDGQEIKVPPAIDTLLTQYRHSRAQPYAPKKAALFIRPIPTATGPIVHPWPFDPTWLAPPDPGTEQWARVLVGDDLDVMLAVVERNMGDFCFSHAGQFYEIVLVPWLPGVDYTDAVAAYRWP